MREREKMNSNTDVCSWLQTSVRMKELIPENFYSLALKRRLKTYQWRVKSLATGERLAPSLLIGGIRAVPTHQREEIKCVGGWRGS